MKERIILGIDPGTLIMGVAVLKQEGEKLKSLFIGNLNLKKEQNYIIKLDKIYRKIIEIIEIYNPDELAIESPFLGKNAQSMLKLGRAQGVVISACLSRGISITEYMPKKIKMSVTGNGNASKEQVSGMVKNILKLKDIPNNFDDSDAMAVAICHYLNSKKIEKIKNTDGLKDKVNQKSKIKTQVNYSSWDSFIKTNKERII